MTEKPQPLSLFVQLLSASAAATQARAEAEKPAWPLNPFPRGVRAGSMTDRVLQELKRVAPQSLEAGQLRMRLGLTRGGLSWAVRYLQATGEIEQLRSPRSPAYRRYRAVACPASPSFGE
ncbi:MAG: hypothetical protein KUL88_14135 [Rhizobium sp.]|nr:hypothetical protein [Rhizobium sp.]